jgi:hypothetical protein
MKKKIIIIWIFLSLFFLVDTVTSNPLPLTNYMSGGPVILTNSSIQFLAENVTYEINEMRYAQVTASYVFYNPTNRTIEQMIALPFRISTPADLQINAGNTTIPYSYDKYSSGLEYDGQSYACAYCYLTFRENETITMKAIYSELYSKPAEFFDNPFFNYKTCTYLAKTGKSWNNTIDAIFTFKINNKMFPIGLNGYVKSYKDGFTIASKSFTHWIPDSDITIEWIAFNIPCLLGIIVTIITIILIIILWRKKKTIPLSWF